MKRIVRPIEFDVVDRPGWVTLARRDDVLPDGQPVIFLDCESKEVPHPPYCCDTPRVSGQGRRPFTFWDEPHGLKAVKVTYHRQRFACSNCGDTDIVEEVTDLVPGHRVSKRAFEYVVRMATRNTFREVARHTGQSEGTLRNMFRSAREAFYAKPTLSPIHMSIDEKHFYGLDEWMDTGKHGIIPNKAKSVVGDYGRRRLIAITDDTSWHLRKFLTSLKDRERTKVVTTDMHGGYGVIIREIFPWARRVVDRFHVVKAMGEALEAFRLELAKQEEKDLGIKRSKLRDKAGLLLTRWHKANEGTRAALGRLFEKYPLLELAYQTKEDFASIYVMAQGSNQAEDMFDSWRESIPNEVRHALAGGMFSNHHRPFVLAYFDELFTNGFIEGMNAVIGDFLRAGRGYSLDVLRFKFIFAKMAVPIPDGLGDKAWMDDTEIEEAIFVAEMIRFEQDQIDDYQAWRDANVKPEISAEEMLGRICASVDWGEVCAPEFTIMLADEDETTVSYPITKGFLYEDEVDHLLSLARGKVAVRSTALRDSRSRPPPVARAREGGGLQLPAGDPSPANHRNGPLTGDLRFPAQPPAFYARPPIAALWKRDKFWEAVSRLPGLEPSRRYAPLDEQKADLEMLVDRWFGLAGMWRPATDPVDEGD